MRKGQKKFIEIGNIFDFAEARLQNLVSRGDMEYYTAVDVVNNAVKIREYLDKNVDKVQENRNIRCLKNNDKKIRDYLNKYLKRDGSILARLNIYVNEEKTNNLLNLSSVGIKIPTQTKEEKRISNLKVMKDIYWKKMRLLRG